MFASVITYLGGTGATIAVTNVLNDQTSLNSNWLSGDPFYVSVDAVDGLSSTDLSVETHPIPNGLGEKSGDIFRRGRGITLTGTIWGRNLGSLDVGSDYLEMTFWDTSERKLCFRPLYGGSELYHLCRVVNDLSIAKNKPQDRSYRWTWTVGLRADDPRLYNFVGDTLAKPWQV